MYEITGKHTTAKVMIDSLEEKCVAQITSFVNHPAFTGPVAIMPDAHYGQGSCVGFTMPMGEKLIPNIIGVDIGCGMLSINVGSDLKLPLEEIDHKIRQRIPFGKEVREHSKSIHMKNDFPWHDANVLAEKFSLAYEGKFGVRHEVPGYDIGWFESKSRAVGADLGRMISSLGTLGGGNHFIEIGRSASTGDYWVTVHSGSRNFGLRVCNYWQNKAYKSLRKDKKKILDDEIAKIRTQYAGEEVGRKIYELKKGMGMDWTVDVNGLEWLEGADAAGYLFDMLFAQKYAEVNRKSMADVICGEVLKVEPKDRVETVHNFIDFRDFTIRKGAVRSYTGERFILPFNMQVGLLICEGKSNPEWNCSAPHGAGRNMSRGDAKRKLSMAKYKSDMEGIFSTSVNDSTLDESPDAYKDPALIEDAVSPTATILDRVKPILGMKDSKGEKDDG